MKILYIDMDGTLVDFEAGIPRVTPEQKERYGEEYDDIPGFFDDLPPIDGAIDAFHKLAEAYDTYILSTAPWNNETAWSAKNLWVRRHPGRAGPQAADPDPPQTPGARRLPDRRPHPARG